MNKNDAVEVEKRYISYFQSVLTVGIISRGKNAEEAEKRANLIMQNKENGVNYCIFEQSPMERSHTEIFEPEFEVDPTSKDGIRFNFSPDEKTKNIIATRMGKKADEMLDSDYEEFIKKSMEVNLSYI
jgi:hypothetical protein